LDDTRLVRGLKKGSDEAFEELLDRYEGKIFSAVLRIVKHVSDAEDVVQEAFLKTLRHIGSFNFQAGLYTWIYRIAVNSALDCRKKRKRSQALSLHLDEERTLEIPSQEDDPSAAPERDEMARLLEKALDELPEKYRTILILREFEDLSYEDISQVLRCSKGTVESRLFRARERLRKKMEKHF